MSRSDTNARRRARELLVQALYQRQLAGHDRAELLRQFRTRPGYERADTGFFDEALEAIVSQQEALEADVAAFADRPVAQLDPVERGILLLGVYELRHRPEIPFRVVINEAVDLAKRFGAEEGHKFVNAVLDRAAAELRPFDPGRRSDG
ncbi:MAG TPA: transcription antitermination factor NusB [Woeseiaceae bacterium]|nr:transcription antitermination factor NusB [Woeseiaceae bacterium]